MTEWWTYSLRDFLLFSPRTYYRLLELYNLEFWPLQLVALVMGVAILYLWQCRSEQANRALAAILALCWLWVAWAYHSQHYASINWAANYYALAFTAEALLLMWLGVIQGQLEPAAATGSARRRIGLFLFVFGLLLFPLLSPLLGRSITQAEMFGMAPDPTVLATLGILLLCGKHPLWWLFPVPVIWSLISGATLWAMDSPDYMVAPLGALLAVLVAYYSRLKHSST